MASSSTMGILADLYRYNAWANARVFAVCAALDATAFQGDGRSTISTVEQTLKHMVSVEDVYLTLIQGLPLGQGGAQEAYFAHDLSWFADRAAHIHETYLQLLASQDGTLLDQPLAVPWFNFPLTARDGLLQVLTHSAQHRSQVLATLEAQGVEAPNIDYVFMVGSAIS